MAFVHERIIDILRSDEAAQKSFDRLTDRLGQREVNDLATLIGQVVTARMFSEINARKLRGNGQSVAFDPSCEFGLSRSETKSVPRQIVNLSAKIANIQGSLFWAIACAKDRRSVAQFESLPRVMRAFGERFREISGSVPKHRLQAEYRDSLHGLFVVLNAQRDVDSESCAYATDLARVLNLIWQNEVAHSGFRWKGRSGNPIDESRFTPGAIKEAYRRFRRIRVDPGK